MSVLGFNINGQEHKYDYDALSNRPSIPVRTSDLINDSGFLTSYTETDPTVPSWAKAPNKPSYTASEVGALPSNTAIPSNISDLNNDIDYAMESWVESEIAENCGKRMPIVTYGEPTVVIDTTTVAFSKDGDNNWYISQDNPLNNFSRANFEYNKIYRITWDNTIYEELAVDYYRLAFYTEEQIEQLNMDSMYAGRPQGFVSFIGIGDVTPLGYITKYNSQAPFCLTYDYVGTTEYVHSQVVNIISYDTNATHTIKIETIPFSTTVVKPQFYENSYHGITADYSKITTNNNGVPNGIAITSPFAKTADGIWSKANGLASITGGSYAQAEGFSCVASGDYASHAEGGGTMATGISAHSEGGNTVAEGNYSHAEGYFTTASGNTSHAEGRFTIANHRAQHVFGIYNIPDPSEAAATVKGNYVEIVGNGTTTQRSNARTLDWSGNEELAGDLVINKGSADETSVGTALNNKITKPNSPTNGQFLKYDNNEWVATDLTSQNIAVFNFTVNTKNNTITYTDATREAVQDAIHNNKILMARFDNQTTTFGTTWHNYTSVIGTINLSLLWFGRFYTEDTYSPSGEYTWQYEETEPIQYDRSIVYDFTITCSDYTGDWWNNITNIEGPTWGELSFLDTYQNVYADVVLANDSDLKFRFELIQYHTSRELQTRFAGIITPSQDKILIASITPGTAYHSWIIKIDDYSWSISNLSSDIGDVSGLATGDTELVNAINNTYYKIDDQVYVIDDSVFYLGISNAYNRNATIILKHDNKIYQFVKIDSSAAYFERISRVTSQGQTQIYIESAKITNNDVWSYDSTQLIPANWGASNAGKVLSIDSNGNVVAINI